MTSTSEEWPLATDYCVVVVNVYATYVGPTVLNDLQVPRP